MSEYQSQPVLALVDKDKNTGKDKAEISNPHRPTQVVTLFF